MLIEALVRLYSVTSEMVSEEILSGLMHVNVRVSEYQRLTQTVVGAALGRNRDIARFGR